MEMLINNKDNLRTNLLVSITLLLMAVLLHGTVLNGNWRWHDAQILLHIDNYAWYADFLNAGAWQEYSPVNLTPWQMVLYRFDWLLSGLTPAVFYVHHMLAIAATAIALYFLLGLWIDRRYAFSGAALMLVGTPVYYVSEQLMTRHYIEGTVYAIAAIFLFVTGLRQSNRGRILASVLFYALAMMSKEIFVPLVIVLLFMPEVDFKSRAKQLWPHFLLIIVYVFWRDHMLTSVVGGYGASPQYLDSQFMATAFTKLLGMPVMLLSDYAWLIWLAVLGSLTLAIRAGRFPWITVLVSTAMLAGPLYPLAGAPGFTQPDRYLFLVWVVFCFFAAWSVGRYYSGRQLSRIMVASVSAPFVLVAAVSIVAGTQVRADLNSMATEFDVQSRFMWEATDEGSFTPTLSLVQDYWAVTDLLELRQRVTGSHGPTPIPDDLFLSPEVNILQAYMPECQCMQDISDTITGRRADFIANNRSLAAMEVEFNYQAGLMSWQFGPYHEGAYHVVSPVMGKLPVPPNVEGLRITVLPGTPIYIRYQSPEGWISYSDELIVVPDQPVSWHRE